MNRNDALGHAPEELPVALREALDGYWVALELYDPHRLPLRKIMALDVTPAGCLGALKSKGLNLEHFEIVRLSATHGSHG